MQHKEQRVRLIGGIFVILMGILALVDNVLAEDASTWLWIAGLAAGAVMFGWAFTYEREAWAAVGCYASGAVALVIFLVAKVNLSDTAVPVVVLLTIALPFIIAWWFDRRRWGFLIPAYIMIVIVPILFLGESADSQAEIVPAYVLMVVALPFLVAYIITRNIGMLIPGGILFFLSLAFFGVGAGMSNQVLTTLIPIVVIVAGAYVLLRARENDTFEQQ